MFPGFSEEAFPGFGLDFDPRLTFCKRLREPDLRHMIAPSSGPEGWLFCMSIRKPQTRILRYCSPSRYLGHRKPQDAKPCEAEA